METAGKRATDALTQQLPEQPRAACEPWWSLLTKGRSDARWIPVTANPWAGPLLPFDVSSARDQSARGLGHGVVPAEHT